MEYITIFGSARFQPNNLYYKKTFELSKKLSKAGYGIVTGGGGGIMEAANHGAFINGGKSIGINVVLPFEQTLNPYCTSTRIIESLSDRKNRLIEISNAFIVSPGGFGTLDEVFEVLTLAQTKLKKHKIIFFCTNFWKPLLDFFDNTLLKNETVSKDDLNLYILTDDFDTILDYIKQ